MLVVLTGLTVLIQVARIAVFAIAVVALVVALLERGVRSRRINPFGHVGRFVRRATDPLLAPFERRLLLSGRTTDSAPWWLLGATIVGGLLLLALLGFVRDTLLSMANAASAGPRGILLLVVSWTFAILRLALLVRVFSSWFRANPFSWWMRTVHALTEWILRPLRSLIPPIGGMIDLSPLIAYFLLGLAEGLVRGAL